MAEAVPEDQEVLGRLRKCSRIQIYSAIIAYCLVATVQHKMKLDRSVNEVLQVLGISLTDTTPLKDLFNKSNFNIDKELDEFYEPTLFDV